VDGFRILYLGATDHCVIPPDQANSVGSYHAQPLQRDQGQSAIRDLFAMKHDRSGNLPPLPATFPDQMAPILRDRIDGERTRFGLNAGLDT